MSGDSARRSAWQSVRHSSSFILFCLRAVVSFRTQLYHLPSPCFIYFFCYILSPFFSLSRRSCLTFSTPLPRSLPHSRTLSSSSSQFANTSYLNQNFFTCIYVAHGQLLLLLLQLPASALDEILCVVTHSIAATVLLTPVTLPPLFSSRMSINLRSFQASAAAAVESSSSSSSPVSSSPSSVKFSATSIFFFLSFFLSSSPSCSYHAAKYKVAGAAAKGAD